MKKIEIIWRELLFQAIEKGNHKFTQKDLAGQFAYSTSTVFQALKVPREMGAVRVTGRFFLLEDSEKLLFHWASVRRLQRDIILKGRINLSALEIEGLAPPSCIFGGYSAGRMILTSPPADYDTVYLYTDNIEAVRERYSLEKGRANLIVMTADRFMAKYGEKTTLAQTFVDLWNINDWQAKEYTNALKEKINELLP